ncbi:uncharacterized protein [Penaeus vannamei]|uniref:uncharacterized protein isoform X2 n=1 Tax=Penaeus vannamei TaxID=6689 RepID=UPI00387F7CDA
MRQVEAHSYKERKIVGTGLRAEAVAIMTMKTEAGRSGREDTVMQRRPGLPRNRFASLLQASDQALIPRKSVLPSWLRHSGTRLGGRSAQVGRAVTSRQSTLSRSGGWTYCAHLCVFSFPRFPTPFRYLQGLAKMENKGFDVEKQESYELQDSPRKENSPAINEIVPACPCEDSQRNCSCKEPKEAKPQIKVLSWTSSKGWILLAVGFCFAVWMAVFFTLFAYDMV